MSREEDIDRELRAHIDLEIEEQRERGRTADAARDAALRSFGNPVLVKEQVRDLSPWIWWERLMQDVRYGLRAMRRQPSFAAVVVLSLGLGIGANAAIFSILNALVLKTLPVREPERLATHELTVRLALGASRLRLARQLLTESALLAAAGAALGLVTAKWGAALIVEQLGSTVSLDLSIDWRVFGYIAGGALGAMLLFGLAPAAGVRRLAPDEALKEQGRSVASDGRFGLRHALVVAQVASSVVLVVGAGLFLRTLVSLTTVPLGFDPKPLLITNVNVQTTPPEQRQIKYQNLQEAAAAVPGVTSAAISDISPLSGQGWNTVITIPGGTVRPQKESMSWVNSVSTDWFKTFGVRIVDGRDFNDSDRRGSAKVAVVNESFARKYFSGQNAIGREFGAREGSFQVVGLVSDSVYGSPRQGAAPTAYLAQIQREGLGSSFSLTVRAKAGDPMRLSRDVAAALGRVDPEAAFSFRAMATQTRATMTQERLVAILSSAFGALALVLAAIGLYGVTSYSVNRRRGEIGIRMALGADAAGVIRLILGRVGWLVGAGVVLGAILSFWASRFIVSSLLFGVEARDPGTFAMASAVLIVVSAVAGWVPARRASRIDPTTVLRES
jgi:putative ABC transport system permease protein